MARRRTVLTFKFRRSSVLAVLAMLAGTLAVVATEAPAAAVTVTGVSGYACGYISNVGLFGGAEARRGCTPQPGGTAASLSPSVSLPAGGSASAITAIDSDGAAAVYGRPVSSADSGRLTRPRRPPPAPSP